LNNINVKDDFYLQFTKSIKTDSLERIFRYDLRLYESIRKKSIIYTEENEKGEALPIKYKWSLIVGLNNLLLKIHTLQRLAEQDTTSPIFKKLRIKIRLKNIYTLTTKIHKSILREPEISKMFDSI
jgi:hypothetical protein